MTLRTAMPACAVATAARFCARLAASTIIFGAGFSRGERDVGGGLVGIRRAEHS